MSVAERTSSKIERANQREYWAGWDERKAGGTRPDETRPFAQQGWDAWSTWLIKRLEVGRTNLLGRLRLSLPRKSAKLAAVGDSGVKLKRQPD